jgi:hypothetical protein
MKSFTYIPLALLLVGIVALTQSQQQPTQAQRDDCSEPQVYEEDPKYLLQYCSDGTNMINTETGEETFLRSGEHNTICDENGQCIQLSS